MSLDWKVKSSDGSLIYAVSITIGLVILHNLSVDSHPLMYVDLGTMIIIDGKCCSL